MAEAQNFTLAAKNYTHFEFHPGSENVDWGGVYNKHNIGARTTTTAVFYARGNRDAAAGTSGSLTYVATQSPETTITFTWSVPWGMGDVFVEVRTTGPIKVDKSYFSGNEVLRRVVEVAIRDDAPVL